MGEDFGNQMMSRIEMLRQDLQMEMQTINPSSGDIIIVRPKDPSIALTNQYRDWIISVLSILRPDVQIMVMENNNIDISVNKKENSN